MTVGTYTVRIENGETVKMTGSIQHLDKITEQMQTHDLLVSSCELALKWFSDGKNADDEGKIANSLHETLAIVHGWIAGQCPRCGGDVADWYSDPVNDSMPCKKCGADIHVGSIINTAVVPPTAV